MEKGEDGGESPSVDNFLTWYPDLQSPEFSEFVVSSREFAEFNVPQYETPPKKGELLTHQKLIGRFLSPNTPYTGLLLFVKVGGGKTCASVTVAEQFKTSMVEGRIRGRPLILVKNDALMKVFIWHIYAVCTSGLYGTLLVEEWRKLGLDKHKIEARLHKKVRKTYEIDTYGKFLNQLAKKPNEWIALEYSNRVIICDEIHKIREHGDTLDNYTELIRLFTNIKNSRIMLMTGTPIWEQPWEVSSIFNLMLPEEKRLPSGNDFMKRYFDRNDRLIKEQELVEAWRGKVSYLKAPLGDTKRIVEGQTKPWFKKIKVYPSQMSPYQAFVANAAETDEQIIKAKTKGKKEIKEKKVAGGSFLRQARDAMNFVYPETDGIKSYGKEAFEKYVKVKHTTRPALKGKAGATAKEKRYVLTQEFKNALKPKNTEDPISDLAQFSCKTATILRLLLTNPKESAFIYCEQVTGGGAILLGLVLSLYGFDKVTQGFTIGPNTPKRKRYVIFTDDDSTISPSRYPITVAGIIDTFNNPLNRFGEYIQVIIGSEVVSEGYTFKNVRQTHLFMPHWNQSSQEQAFGRTLRYGSHDAFNNPEERYVKYYSHAAVYSRTSSEDLSTDLLVYRSMESKEMKNAQLYRVLKIIAFDCALTYRRNVTPQDEDGSRDCDYEQCNYQCLDLIPNTSERIWSYDYPITDWTNYNILYYYDNIIPLVEDLRKVFRVKPVLTLTQLQMVLSYKHPGLNLHSLTNVLDVVMNAQISIPDYLGFGCVLNEDHGNYFLDEYRDHRRDTLHQTSAYALSTYTYNPILLSTESFAGIVEYITLAAGDLGESRLCRYLRAPTSAELYKLPYAEKVLLIEQAYVHQHDHPSQPVPKGFSLALDSAKTSIYSLANGKVIHVMYLDEYTGQSYNTVVKKYEAKGQTRVFVPSPNEGVTSFWVNEANFVLEKSYIEQTKKLKTTQMDDLLDNEYHTYGTIGQDGKFRIRITKKGKGETRGKVCSSHKPSEVYEVYKNLGYWPEKKRQYEGMTKPQLLKVIRGAKKFSKIKAVAKEDTLSQDDLVGLASYVTSKLKGYDLCFALQLKMAELGILFTVDGTPIGPEEIRTLNLVEEEKAKSGVLKKSRSGVVKKKGK